jgi:hypothetical protein
MCDECGSVKLEQLIPDLLLKDMKSLQHLDLDNEVCSCDFFSKFL